MGPRKRARSEPQASGVHRAGSAQQAGAARAQRGEAERSSFKPAGGERSSLRPGFTLLEVMAAVALLGILYTVLARVAIEGLRAEGESERRLEACLLADARLADSFTGINGNVVMPDLGHRETTEGAFTLAIDVSLFQPPVEWDLAESKENPPLLFASTPGAAGTQALRTVELTVSWLEGAEERHVSRTMYLLDFGRAAGLAAAADQSQAAAGNPGTPQAPESPAPPSDLELP